LIADVSFGKLLSWKLLPHFENTALVVI